MDQFSPARLSESAASASPSERLTSSASGTRRVKATALAPNPAALPRRAPGLPPSPSPSLSAAPRWRIQEPLRGWGIVASIAAATAAGSAGALLAPSPGGDTAAAGIAMGMSVFFLGLAALAWTAPHWHTPVRLELLRSWSRAWLALKLKLLAFDLRALPRAPKNLALCLASQWLFGVGLAGLIGAGGLGLGQQIFGRPIAASLLGLSLSSAALIAASQLIGWALRVQPRGTAAATDGLALAAREFPAIVDASRPLEIDTVFMQPTLLHEVLDLLPSWRDLVRGAGAQGYAAALQRHLWRGIPLAQIERKATAASQADGSAELLMDGALLVVVQVGIDAPRARALAARLRNQARLQGARPIVVVVLEARAEALLQSDAAAPLVRLHEALPVVIAVLP